MSKIIKEGKECRSKVAEGMKVLYDMVSMTLGPGGKNVAIVDGFGGLKITKDGVTVAKSVKIDDEAMNIGAMLLKEAAQKTCDESGDGTTTTTVLAYNLIKECENYIDQGGITVTQLRNSLTEACKQAVDAIKKIVIECKDAEDIHNVALISSNGDKMVADLVTEAIVKATKDGAVSIENSQSTESYVDVVTGMRFEKGYESPYFINDENMKTCTFDAPNILVIRGKVDNVNNLVTILGKTIKEGNGRPVLIMADEFEHDIINMLAVNKVQEGVKVCAVKLPSFGEQRDAMTDDICKLIGCQPITYALSGGYDFDIEKHVGSCDKIIVDLHNTTIAGGDGDPNVIAATIEQLREEINHEMDSSTIARLKERLVKLSGGVAVIHIGANSDTEVNEIKDRVDDAVCAVRSALQEGIVPGSGFAYCYAMRELAKMGGYGSEGREILIKTLPVIRKMVYDNMEVSRQNQSEWYDASNAEGNELMNKGIMDPFKSIHTALENAVSVACMFLIMNGCVIEKHE